MPPSPMNHGKAMAESCLGDSSNYASSSGLKRLKQFPQFFERHPLNKALESRGCNQLQGCSVPRSDLSTFKAIQGKGQSNSNLHPVNPSKPVRSPPAGTGMSLELSLKPTVSNQHSTGGTYQTLSPMRRTFVFLGSRRPRPLTSGNAHPFRCNVSKWRTGLRERLKN